MANHTDYEDVHCPYCENPQDINHDDGRGYDQNVTHQQDCDVCGKTFVFTTEISFNYNAEKADCLNEGGEHNWEPTATHPKYFTQMRCTMCGEYRIPTDEERTKYEIPLTYDA